MPEDLRVERRKLDVLYKHRAQKRAIVRARTAQQSAAAIAAAAEEAVQQYTSAGDEQMVLAGKDALNEEDVLQEGECMLEMDESLDEIHEVGIAEGVQQALAELEQEYTILTRAQRRAMTKQQQQAMAMTGLD